MLDVDGARTVNLMFGIPSNDPDVHWGRTFRPHYKQCIRADPNRNVRRPQHNWDRSSGFGTGMLLFIENRGNRHESVDGKIYFIRDLP